MPPKIKVTKEVLIDIVEKLYRPDTAEQVAARHGLTTGKIERLASKLRTQGAKIPKQPRVYKNSLTNMIQDVKKERQELFA